MSLLDELEDLVDIARRYKRLMSHAREVVARPIIKSTCGFIDPEEIDDDWFVKNLEHILKNAGENNRVKNGLSATELQHEENEKLA